MFRKVPSSLCVCLALVSSGQQVDLSWSGGSGGLTHIGAIKALEENDIPTDYITGKQHGARSIGAMYAAGLSPDQMDLPLPDRAIPADGLGGVEDEYIPLRRRTP